MELSKILSRFYSLPEAKLQSLCSLFELKDYKKGAILIREGRVNNNVYCVASGLTRAFACVDGKESTFWFGDAGSMAIPMQSIFDGGRDYCNVEMLEDGRVYVADRQQLSLMYNQDLDIANWGRKLTEYYSIEVERDLINRFYKTATERYEELLSRIDDIINRVPLGIIASYLGISPVSLSRIRGKK